MNRELYDWRRDGAPEGRQRWVKVIRGLGRIATFAAICIALTVFVAMQAGGGM